MKPYNVLCKGCKYYVPTWLEMRCGLCLRHQPEIEEKTTGLAGLALVPIVAESDFCDEGERKEPS